MSLFDSIADPNPPPAATVPGICQECRQIHEVPDGEAVFACTLHENQAPVLTVANLFSLLAQINKALKAHGDDPGVLKHKETFLDLMREIQGAILAEPEEVPT